MVADILADPKREPSTAAAFISSSLYSATISPQPEGHPSQKQ